MALFLENSLRLLPSAFGSSTMVIKSYLTLLSDDSNNWKDFRLIQKVTIGCLMPNLLWELFWILKFNQALLSRDK